MKKIIIASDHGGFDTKKVVADFLTEKGYEIEDIGTDSNNSVDYPDFAHKAAQKVADNPDGKAILICGTGIGMSIAANRHKGVRAALVNDIFSARMSRLHNDSNILVLGGRLIGVELAKEIVDTWLNTEFEGGRHTRRLDKIDNNSL